MTILAKLGRFTAPSASAFATCVALALATRRGASCRGARGRELLVGHALVGEFASIACSATVSPAKADIEEVTFGVFIVRS